MRLFLLAAVVIPAIRAEDVMDIVHAYVARQASHYDRTRDYTYEQRVVTRRYKRDGALKSNTTETYEVLIVDGKPVRKLVERDGKPVSPEVSLRRQRELERASARARPRLGHSLLDRYETFQLEGEEDLNGRLTWVVSARAKLLSGLGHAQAKLWIDEMDLECARSETESSGGLISLDGWAHGAGSGTAEYVRFDDGVWLPVRTLNRFDASIPLTLFPVSLLAQKQEHWELETTYTNYEKFQADSHIIGVTEFKRHP